MQGGAVRPAAPLTRPPSRRGAGYYKNTDTNR
nr:MAG TPA: hypothetical protein [Caudoviricetes sp.]